MIRWSAVRWLAFAVTMLSGASSSIALPPSRVDSAPPLDLAGKSLDEWVDALTPPPADLAWETIPWRASFSDGLIAADRAERPLLLWLMNGHPLGCT